MSDSGDTTNVDDHAKENCALTSIDKRKHSPSPIEPEAKKQKVEGDELSDEESSGQRTPTSVSATATPTRRTRTPRFPVDTEAEKLRKAEEKLRKDEERETARKLAEEKKRMIAEQKENERLQKEEQKENERRQKEEQKENERRERERQKEEKRLKKEQEDREKEEKRKQKLEEEERKKEEKRKQKELKEQETEKKRLEEEKRKKEKDERREAERKEEEERKEQKRKEEEAYEVKKRRESARFLGFFKPIERPQGAQASDDDNLWYKPFERKPGMVVAPELRRSAIPSDVDILNTRDVPYLKSPNVVNRKLVGGKKSELKAKLFQFHENYRPAYYGTWRKHNKAISCKRPWLQSKEANIDYDVDSGDDWEDEPSDAEECKSDEEDPDDGKDDGEESDADGWMVEPDYLSDGEGSDEEGVREGEAPEARAMRLAGRAREWSENVKRKTETKIKNPVCIGPIFGTTPICEKLGGCIAVIL